MARARLFSFALGALLVACQVDPSRSQGQPSPSPVKLGQALEGLAPTPLADILARPAEFDGRTVAVSGHVARACSRKGCWMEIAVGPEDAAPSCRVTFENYAFFVPKDSPGSAARLEGKVTTARIKPSHVEHLESEGARFSSKNPDGSALEVQIVATGVELQPRPRSHPSSASGS